MPAFILKVVLEDGYILPPVTAMAANEAAAEKLARDCLIVGDKDTVQSKGIRDDVMSAAYGDQPEGTVTIRSDWIWSKEDKPAKE